MEAKREMTTFFPFYIPHRLQNTGRRRIDPRLGKSAAMRVPTGQARVFPEKQKTRIDRRGTAGQMNDQKDYCLAHMYRTKRAFLAKSPVIFIKKGIKLHHICYRRRPNPVLLSQTVQKWRTIENDYSIPQIMAKSSFYSVHCLCVVRKT